MQPKQEVSKISMDIGNDLTANILLRSTIISVRDSWTLIDAA